MTTETVTIPPRRRGPEPRPDLAVVRRVAKAAGVTYHHARLVWLGERKSPLMASINAAMVAAGLPPKTA